MSENAYDQYLNSSLDRLLNCIKDMQCRPILFAGSGLSLRYMKSPTWKGLLKQLVDDNPLLERPLDYFIINNRENGDDHLPRVASEIVPFYFDYAWKTDTIEKEIFPSYIYTDISNKDVYLKTKASEIINHFFREFKEDFENGDHEYMEELSLLSKIDPHAIITTNYDEMLDTLFSNYEVIVGQQIIRRSMYTHVGEILKIHGTTRDPASLVLTNEDYIEFMKKKKYLSAQLLTYFIEHPVVILGYSIQDENIKSILSDIAEILDDPNTLLPNIWIIEWTENIELSQSPPKEKLLDLGGNKTLRVNVIVAHSFKDIYKTLGASIAVEKVNMKLLRNLARSVFNIVRSRTTQLKVNVATLNALSDEEHLFNVLSVQDLNPEALTALYQYRLSDITREWGQHANEGSKIIHQICTTTMYDIRSSQNKYHINMNQGRRPMADRWYSQAAKELLTAVYYQRPVTISLPTGDELEYPYLVENSDEEPIQQKDGVHATNMQVAISAE